MKIFDNIPLKGWSFSLFKEKNITPFEKLFEIFKELITYTSGDFDEAIDWLRQLDKEYLLTDEDYTIDDFIEDLLQICSFILLINQCMLVINARYK